MPINRSSDTHTPTIVMDSSHLLPHPCLRQPPHRGEPPPMAPPDVADALQAGIHLARVLNSAGIRLRHVDVTADLQVDATAGPDDIDALADLVAERTGRRLAARGGEGLFRAHGAGMRLTAALEPLGIEVHARGIMDDGRGSRSPAVRVLAAPEAAVRLAEFIENRR